MSDEGDGTSRPAPPAEGQEIVDRIVADMEHLPLPARRAIMAPGVLEAIRQVPRHLFVPADVELQSREDRPLPIGYGQTISQPLIVALMTGLLRPQWGHRILEIGTGSGYQAAVLSHLVRHVTSIEVIAPLAARAADALAACGIANVEIHVGDGREGWAKGAPYDGIIVTASPPELPVELQSQLAEGGRLVVPVGRRDEMLKVIQREPGGAFATEEIIPVRFVPLV